jgi:hypothetical protein
MYHRYLDCSKTVSNTHRHLGEVDCSRHISSKKSIPEAGSNKAGTDMAGGLDRDRAGMLVE